MCIVKLYTNEFDPVGVEPYFDILFYKHEIPMGFWNIINMSSGTFTQIYIQIVFAVKGRHGLISPAWEGELYKYITGIVQHKGQKMLAINGMPDHIHIFIGMNPTCQLSDLVREIKKSSNKFINDKKLTRGRFEWQAGYGGFSYSHSALNNVINYIAKQKEHHQTKSFKEEYMGFLRKFDVEYQTEYLFEWIE